MVSRTIKRTPTKSIKDCRSRRCRRKSPIKNATASAASRVVKSICSCHRRLMKIFSNLAKMGTPRRSSRKKGYQVLKKFPAGDNHNIRRQLFVPKTLPPVTPPERKTVFLDLDETLVHSTPEIPPAKFDFIVRPVIDSQKVDFYVLKRPFVDELLEILSKEFEIVVFTAGIEEYASLVLDRLDPRKYISHRLYRDSCKEMDGKFVKDLSELGRDMKRVVIVDDNPNSYVFQPDNAIRVNPFTDDLEDGELKKLMDFFEKCDCCEDMRDAVKKYVAEGEKLVELELGL